MADKNYNDDKFKRFSLDDNTSTAPDEEPLEDYSPVGGKNGGGARPPQAAGFEKRDYRPVRQRRDGKTGVLGGFMYFVFVISVSLIIACLGWMAASDVLALNKAEVTTEVYIPEEYFHSETLTETDDNGVSTTKNVQVADIGKVAGVLKDAGIIEYKALFRLYSAISDAKYKIDPGTYELSTIFDYRAIVKKIQFGSDSQVRTMVTFPEGFTVEDVFQRLEENKICKFEDLMECAATHQFNYSFLENIPYGDATRLEGFLFPDTYEFYQGMTPQAAIDTFLKIFYESRLTEEMLNLAAEKGFSLRDVMNFAALIEKEAANDDERKEIAGVIYNRLNRGEILGIDAAMIYYFPGHKIPDGRDYLTNDDFAIDTPYNLRKYTGLPPTPICNPGMASIMAVLKPNTTNNYFYALDEATGVHRFFTNANDFNAFVATQSYGQ